MGGIILAGAMMLSREVDKEKYSGRSGGPDYLFQIYEILGLTSADRDLFDKWELC